MFKNKPNFSAVLILLSPLIFICCTESSKPIKKELDYGQLSLPDQPNIVWIVAEDLSPYIPSYGDSTVTTPHIARLASEGVIYTNVYSPSGVCAPSRAAIATGMYPTRIGAMHMRTGPWFNFKVKDKALRNYGRTVYEAKPPEGTHMHSEYLRRAGYYCTNNDKQDYQFRCEMTAWDGNGREAHWKNRPEGKPFFAIFNLNVTHESKIWAKAKDSLWVDKDLNVPVEPYLPDTEIAKNDIRRMYSNIKEMDQEVGEILKGLEENGLLENTIIFWYTDHGGPLPRQKRTVYDSGIKVPMIVRFPNKQFAGMNDDQLLSFVDFKPTILSLAGIAKPAYSDGRAWMGKYRDNQPRKYVYAAADRFDYQHDRIRAVRDQQFKYIKNYIPEKPYYLPVKYREGMAIMKELLRLDREDKLNEHQAQWFRQEKDAEELFDTFADPDELHNLANDPRYSEKLTEFRKALGQWVRDTDDKGLMPEEEYIKWVGSYWEQPETVRPTMVKKENTWILETATKGASIGYQWLNEGEEPGEYWNIYKHPIPHRTDKNLVVRAHRIGYKPSGILGI